MRETKIFQSHKLQTLLENETNIIEHVALEINFDHTKHIVLYVVQDGKQDNETLFTRLTDELGLSAIVTVASIPFDSNGNIDLVKLSATEVIDSKLIQQLNESFNTENENANVAFYLKNYQVKSKPYILTDFFPRPKEQHLTTAVEVQAIPDKSSLANGGELVIDLSSPKTLTEALLQTAAKHGSKRGIYFIDEHGQETFQSYQDLLNSAKSILAGLKKYGLKSGSRVILQLNKFSDHFSTFWACVLGGFIPVTVAIPATYREKNSVTDKITNTWQHLQQPIILTNENLLDNLQVMQTIYELKEMQILAIDNFLALEPVAEAEIYPCKPDDLIFYQLTSGSTGTPKCIQERHSSIIAHIHGSRIFNNYTENEVSLNWLPMDHVVPILTFHLRDVYLGYNQVMVRTMHIISQPLRWLDLMEKYKVTLSWAPNFGFKLVSDKLIETKPDKMWNLSSIHYLMNAGEQVTALVANEFNQLTAKYGIKENMMQPAFGMAEVCTCMTYNNNYNKTNCALLVCKDSLHTKLKIKESQDNTTVSFVDLGPPIPGVEIRIADESNKTLNEAHIGRLQIRGKVVTPGYLFNEKANEEAFVGDNWFNTGDIGFILNSRLYLTGREKEIIIIRGANYYCYEIEDAVNSVNGVQPTYVAATSLNNANSGTEQLAIFFVPKEIEASNRLQIIASIKQKIQQSFGLSADIVIPLNLNDFPKTTSGKIQRKQLKTLLENGKFDQQISQINSELTGLDSIPDWFYNKTWIKNSVFTGRTLKNISALLIITDSKTMTAQHFQKHANIGPIYEAVLGSEYKELEANKWQIDPNNYNDFIRLFQTLKERNITIHAIIDFTLYTAYADDKSCIQGSFNEYMQPLLHLSYLARAVIDQFNSSKLHLIVATTYTCQVKPSDLLAPQKSLVFGVLSALPRENKNINTTLLDLEYNVPDLNLATSVAQVLTELENGTVDLEIAYRSGERYTARLIKIDLVPANNTPILKSHGNYIIVGGLGGIGLFLAEFILKKLHANVIILGSSAKSANLHKLEKLQQETQFEYFQVDVTNLQELQKFYKEYIEANNIKPDAIFHLAGVYSEQSIASQSSSISDVIKVKVLGALNLANTFDLSKSYLIYFSSVVELFGGAMVADYAAANRFLSSHSSYLNSKGMQCLCIDWSIWNNIGISKDHSGIMNLTALGFSTIEPRHGIESLQLALMQKVDNIIVGIDRNKDFIRRYLIERNIANKQLLAICASTKIAEQLTEANLFDIVGNKINLETIVVAPERHSAKQSVDNLILLYNKEQKIVESLPENDLETAICAVWEKYLNLKITNINTNFFELGGTSVILMQVCDDINSKYNTKLSLIDMLNYPNIKKLAEYLKNNDNTLNIETNENRRGLLRRSSKNRDTKNHE